MSMSMGIQNIDVDKGAPLEPSSRAVKYLYKYTYKGPDRACLEHTHDEVTQFLDARYIGAPEAAWRLLQYPLQAKSHQVERLPVHLPLNQSVLFESGHEAEAVDKALASQTKLEAWFHLNATFHSHDPETQQLIKNLKYSQ
eukprot:627252-Karenia_brevis.AAC.1